MPSLEDPVFAAAGVDASAVSGSAVFRTRDARAARNVAHVLYRYARKYYSDTHRYTVDGDHGARCWRNTKRTIYQCNITVGRYAGVVKESTPAQLTQALAAQKQLLRSD